MEEVARHLEYVVLRARLLSLGREEVAQVARLLPALAGVGATRGVGVVGRDRIKEAMHDRRVGGVASELEGTRVADHLVKVRVRVKVKVRVS